MNFNDDSSSSEDEREKYMKRKAQLTASKSKEAVDSSYYLYDEVYDSMKNLTQDKNKNVDGGSQYIGGLLTAKAQREIDNQTAREGKIKLQMLKDKELYGDKEVFVTSSYKAFQDEQDSIKKTLSEISNKSLNDLALREKFLRDQDLKYQRAIEATENASLIPQPNKPQEPKNVELSAGLNVVSEKPVPRALPETSSNDNAKIKEHRRPLEPERNVVQDFRDTRLEKFKKLLDDTRVSEEDLSSYKKRYLERIQLT